MTVSFGVAAVVILLLLSTLAPMAAPFSPDQFLSKALAYAETRKPDDIHYEKFSYTSGDMNVAIDPSALTDPHHLPGKTETNIQEFWSDQHHSLFLYRDAQGKILNGYMDVMDGQRTIAKYILPSYPTADRQNIVICVAPPSTETQQTPTSNLPPTTGNPASPTYTG